MSFASGIQGRNNTQIELCKRSFCDRQELQPIKEETIREQKNTNLYPFFFLNKAEVGKPLHKSLNRAPFKSLLGLE